MLIILIRSSVLPSLFQIFFWTKKNRNTRLRCRRRRRRRRRAVRRFRRPRRWSTATTTLPTDWNSNWIVFNSIPTWIRLFFIFYFYFSSYRTAAPPQQRRTPAEAAGDAGAVERPLAATRSPSTSNLTQVRRHFSLSLPPVLHLFSVQPGKTH